MSNIDVYHHSYASIIEAYKELTVRDNTWGPVSRAEATNFKEGNNFYGDANHTEILRRIENGYKFDHMPENLLPDAGEGEGSRWFFTDDPDSAEYQWDMDEIGEMDYYLRRKPVTGHPGIRLQVMIDFMASVRSETITAYGKWVGSLIETLQNMDYDLEIDFLSHSKDFYSDNPRVITRHEIEVCKFGEDVFFEDFAVFFSPGGYRHLIFTSYLICEQTHRISRGLGRSYDADEWKLVWNDDTRTLEIKCNAHSNTFPAEHLNKQLSELEID